MAWKVSPNHQRSLEAAGRLQIKGDIGPQVAFSFTVTAKLPPSVNSYLKRSKAGGVHKTEKAKNYQSDIGKLAKEAGARMAEGDISVIVRFYADPEEIDLDNGQKVLLDSFNLIAWIDDKQIRRLLVERFPKPPGNKKGFAVVTIERFHGGN